MVFQSSFLSFASLPVTQSRMEKTTRRKETPQLVQIKNVLTGSGINNYNFTFRKQRSCRCQR